MIKKDYYPYESFIEKSVLKHLEKEWGCDITKIPEKELWEHGVDIKVKMKYPRYWLIEVKGGSKSKNASSVDTNNFVFGLGQIVTRIQSITPPKSEKGSNKYGVAYPDYFIKYLQRRRLHWNLCKSLNLYIFLVDKNGNTEEYNWKRIKDEFYN